MARHRSGCSLRRLSSAETALASWAMGDDGGARHELQNCFCWRGSTGSGPVGSSAFVLRHIPNYHWDLRCVWVRSGVDDAGRGLDRKGEEVAVMAPQWRGQRGLPLSPSYFPAMALDETGAILRGREDDQPGQRSQHHSISDPVLNLRGRSFRKHQLGRFRLPQQA